MNAVIPAQAGIQLFAAQYVSYQFISPGLDPGVL
jgi:hypothetical protein